MAATAALTVALPPFSDAAVAQWYYGPPSGAVRIYPPPRDVEDAQPPGDPDAAYPPRDAEAAHPPRDQAEAPAQQVSGTTTPTSVVSMRSGPGTNNPVIGTLHHGMALQILATANHGWMQVQSPAGTGWVYGSYLESGTNLPPQAADANALPSAPAQTNNGQANEGDHPPTTANYQPASNEHLPPGAANPALSAPPPLKNREISSP